ncbi:MAG TPA: alkaline phosphatase family protein [Kofleriaceae bacterium]|nr:alkaline phosphatase family protein [Kofleriaceae bacterium]
MLRDAVRALVVGVLALGFYVIADFRRDVIAAVIGNDAAPSAAAHRLPTGTGAPLTPTPIVRVVLVDGAGADTARTMAAWNGVCARGLELSLDVGFPTVSLPVQLALWSGRTQQQTGVLFHSGKVVKPPLGATAIPAQVPGSIAVAESHPYIVQSLGFADARPPLDKKLPEGWATRWIEDAVAAVASPQRLVFVHILRVDTAGHKAGKESAAWRDAAAGADHVLAQLLAAAPADARWFVLADHDHIRHSKNGGHASEERGIRIVRACIAGPGVRTGTGGPIHITDLSRAIADSLGVTLAADAPGRPLEAAIAAPVGDDDVLPTVPRGHAAVAWVLVLAGLAATVWAARKDVLAYPWWWAVAMLALVLLERAPTLSTPMIYKPKGLDMAQAMAPGLGVLAVSLLFTVRRAGWMRASVAQLVLPVVGTLAVLVACGGAPLLVGDAVCPIVPFWTGWLSPLLLLLSAASGVAALVLLATAVLSSSGPSAPPGTRRSEPAAP